MDNYIYRLLQTLSPRDIKFRKWKEANEKLAMELVGVDNKLATKLGECATWLLFRQSEKTNSIKLKKANFCRQKICPLCSWRKRLLWLGKLNTSLNTIKCLYRDSKPQKRFKLIFLTLSQQNCLLDDLGNEVKHMSSAWHRFINPSPKISPFPEVFPSDGYFRALEVTTKLDKNFDVYCNVHYHVLMVAPQGYGKNKFVTQPDWVKAWRISMQLDYDPTAHVKFIKFGEQSEIVKYLCKPLNYSIGIERTLKLYANLPDIKVNRKSDYSSLLVGLSQQLKGCQQFSTGGLIRRYIPDRKDESDDENYINCVQTSIFDNENKELPNLFYLWQKNLDTFDYFLQI